jgi:hypothetical protein
MVAGSTGSVERRLDESALKGTGSNDILPGVSDNPVLVWFGLNLRLADNPALEKAITRDRELERRLRERGIAAESGSGEDELVRIVRRGACIIQLLRRR